MPSRTDLLVSTVRCLAADLVQQYKGGHPGTAMGAAPIGVSLWRDVMRFNPNDPLWFNRDRFVLSAGHACLLQYLFLHFSGYPVWTLDEIKRYHSYNFGTSRAAGHPEIEPEIGVEVTTGPLGQGIANSVGLAIAGKNLAARYNKPGYESLINNTIWCFTGDGCLQEGVGQEAISVAGHLGLDNLVLIYDANKVTVDGTIDDCFTEDIPLRFKAANWNVLLVTGQFSTPSEHIKVITEVLLQAKAHTGQPTLVVIPTIIGVGSKKANTNATHGAALGDDDVAHVKSYFGFSPSEKFVVPKEIYEEFAHVGPRGEECQKEWTALLTKYGTEHPTDAAELLRRIKGDLPTGWQDLLPKKEELPTAARPTRKSSGIVVQKLAPTIEDLVVGSADLLESTFVNWKGMVEFQKPSSGLGDYSGRQIRYGIREFSMAAIGNGLSAYWPQHPYNPLTRKHDVSVVKGAGGIVPVYSTFFMFMAYALPGIRMAALQGLRAVCIATHDSIGIGEDGPTHQPIALPTFYRALPNTRLWRPADAEETMAGWIDALTWVGKNGKTGPTLLCLSRQALPILEGTNRETARARGAYTIWGSKDVKETKLVLVATGSEVSRAIEVAKELSGASSPLPEWVRKGIRVVSAPCLNIFHAQPAEYRQETLPSHTALVISIEAWSTSGWERYAHAGAGMTTFGHSGPQDGLFDFFGFGVKNLVGVVGKYVNSKVTTEGQLRIPGVGDWEELLADHVPHH